MTIVTADATKTRAPAPISEGVDAVFQRTLKKPVTCSGIGLHSGLRVSLTLIPAQPGRGILFRRTDMLAGSGDIPALWNRVHDTRMCTVLANDLGASVGTVEHLMAALAGCGIDNAVIELDGPEVPVMDGSSKPFVDMIQRAGVILQAAPRQVIRVLKPVAVEDGEVRAELRPAEVFSLDMEIEFASAAIKRQTMQLGVVNGAFCKELAQARTFGFLHEVEALRAAGLAQGGSLENAIVIDGDRVMNTDGLRFDDEFVRHKALDAVGDLYLAGAQVIGTYVGRRAGHAITNRLLHALFADPTAWRHDIMGGDELAFAVDGDITAEPVAA